MRCTKPFLFVVFLLFHVFAFAQQGLKSLHGKIISNEGSKEGVTIINVSKGIFVVSDDAGYFDINSQAMDTLRFISPTFLLYTYVIKDADFDRDPVLFPLERNKSGEILEEIIITKKPSHIYTYKSKGPSPVERKLASATSGIITPLINLINGRTAMLKKALLYEREGFRVEKFLDYIPPERLTTQFNIPYDYVEGFAFYAVLNDKVKEALVITPVDVHYLEGIITPLAVDFLDLINQDDKKMLNNKTE
ncbi:hypothetical protein HX039_01055 [Myroides marinus]|uniref:hypothetical protein n=1 Tax=Myroides marinus TaxID=703342 RepID=UPI002578B241|nr:hypothetical protein [Myroides marinus]MDM1402696.1 hypothetical protein [Myroides marinus]